jgi:drug/metabolite transporter (DMT)-like permease
VGCASTVVFQLSDRSGVVPPHLLAMGRWGLVVLILTVWRGPTLWAHRHILQREAPHLFVLGALGMWICGAWVYLAGQGTSATNIGLIYAAAPVGIALGGAKLLGEPLALRQVLAMALAGLGVIVVILKGDWRTLQGLAFDVGDIWAALAMVSWVGFSLLQRHWPSGLSPVDRLWGCSVGGLVCLAPFATWEALYSGPVGQTAWGLMVLAGLVPGLGSYLAYAYMQRELGVARAGLVLYLAPLYGGVLAWALLNEPVRWYHALGCALILPGIRFSAPRSR